MEDRFGEAHLLQLFLCWSRSIERLPSSTACLSALINEGLSSDAANGIPAIYRTHNLFGISTAGSWESQRVTLFPRYFAITLYKQSIHPPNISPQIKEQFGKVSIHRENTRCLIKLKDPRGVPCMELRVESRCWPSRLLLQWCLLIPPPNSTFQWTLNIRRKSSSFSLWQTLT
ncbi:hypothetical protein L2E82_05248 [Cichorium intybus]|uniref:Uncharacterized protein n=1 Tax=Cichorium intybus TaxID=13427 RepID=A0ACB9H829_CICIN|nr:hypothetical protein L2E82_05248 [Cichorium intybus]